MEMSEKIARYKALRSRFFLSGDESLERNNLADEIIDELCARLEDARNGREEG